MKRYLLFFFLLFFSIAVFAQDTKAKREIYVSAYLDQAEQKNAKGGNVADLSVHNTVKYDQPHVTLPDRSELPQEATQGKPAVIEEKRGGFVIHSPFESSVSNFDFGPTAKTIQGYSTYRTEFSGDVKISDTPPVTITVPGASELRFPISGYFGGGQIAWYQTLRDQERHNLIRATLDWYTHAVGSRGRMRDSDWFGPPIDDGGRDIYSESRVGLSGYGLDGRLAYNAFSLGDTVFTGPILGIKYEKFQFKCSDLEQIGNGLFAPSFTMTSAGPSLDYTVQFTIPYLGWGADICFDDQYTLKLAGGYSFLTDVRDRDDHLLRSKLSLSHTQGSAAFAEAKLSWDIDKHWQVSSSLQYLYISTSGHQIQQYYDGSTSDKTSVNDQIKSTQLAIDAGLTYKF